jgi:putative hemolysin
MKKTFLFLCVGLAFVLSGCQLFNQTAPAVTDNKTDVGQPVQMANPASTNCLEKGGKLEMRQNKNGDYGVCLFEDNRQCEEWALFRDQCPVGGKKVTGYENDAQIFCAITGGEVQGVGTSEVLCKRLDGTLCAVQANFNGECPDPKDPNPSAGNVEAP